MRICSWRAVGRLLLAIALLVVFAPRVRSQLTLSTAPKWGQHEARRNRVWSMRLQFKTCAVTIDHMRIAVLDAEGNMGSWRPANPKLTILQWNQVLPIESGEERESTYGLYDLLSDYGQTRYVVQLVGSGATPGSKFVKFFFVTPVGVSDTSIETAPRRANRNVEWSDEDSDALLNWMNEHEYGHTFFFREFRGLLRKSDKKIDIIVRINGSQCEQGEKQ